MFPARATLIAAATVFLSLIAGARAEEAGQSQTATYQVDPVHSELTFRVRHLLGRVPGTFRDWGGTVVFDPANQANSRVDVEIRTASIDTGTPDRDKHLRTADFFDVEKFPTMTFRSTNVSMLGKVLRVRGDLTIRGRTKPVLLAGTYEGTFQDPWGKTRTAFFASTTINRHDFGVSYQGPFQEIGQIGDEIWIEIAIEAVKQEPVEPKAP